MRERNNEASKRCRLKRRIKQVTIVMIVMVMKRRRNKKEKREITFWNWFQDSLDKTKILLESHREALSHRFPFIFFSFAQNLFHILQQQNWFSSIFFRVAKLHKIKNILNDACRSMGKVVTIKSFPPEIDCFENFLARMTTSATVATRATSSRLQIGFFPSLLNPNISILVSIDSIQGKCQTCSICRTRRWFTNPEKSVRPTWRRWWSHSSWGRLYDTNTIIIVIELRLSKSRWINDLGL